MTRYNHSRFTPGNKANLRLFMNKAYINQYYRSFNNAQAYNVITTGSQLADEQLCGCIQNKSNSIKQGWNDPSQTENKRISQILTGTLGGKTTFGNNNKPILLNYLGGYEGQSGGLPKPPRNKF
jgi:hypothetical protein